MTKRDEQMIRFSVIVPAYNAEKTLKSLTDSLLAQTYPAWEIILVDDGSTDETGEIADELVKRNTAENDSSWTQWKTIHKPANEGLPKARNTGLKQAGGDWVLFLDSDDSVEPGLLAQIAEAIQRNQHSDIVAYSILEDFVDAAGKVTYSICHQIPDQTLREGLGTQSNPGTGSENRPYDAEKARLAQELENATLYGYAWNKAYRRSFLIENDLRFPTIPFIEDILFNIRCFDAADRISALKQPLYHYINQDRDRLTGKYIPNYFDLQKRRYTEFLKQQARWLCSGREDLQELKQSALGRSALELISGRYFRSFSSAISRELAHGTNRDDIAESVHREMENGELYRLLREDLPDLGMSGRFLYQPLQHGRVKQAIRHAAVLNRVRKSCPGLYNRLKQNR